MTEKKKPDVVVTKEVLPEAPASVTIKAYSSKGYDMMFTLRDVDEVSLMQRLIKYFAVLEEQYHISPTRPTNGGQPQQNVSRSTPSPTPDGEHFFEAEELVGRMEGGKTYWKVKGGKFSQYGVTIYPEVLEAAGFVNLDAATVYDLSGHTAYYSVNDKGNPAKVLNLAKA
jgi:hypothetical protein